MNPYEQPFQTWLKKRDASPKSIRAYLSDLRQFVDWFETSNGEPFALADIDWRDIQDWRDTAEKTFKLQNQGLSQLPSNARQQITLIARMMISGAIEC